MQADANTCAHVSIWREKSFNSTIVRGGNKIASIEAKTHQVTWVAVLSLLRHKLEKGQEGDLCN